MAFAFLLMETRLTQMSMQIVELLRSNGYTFATAESCTGGAIASAITRVAGCSDVMLGGVVAYHNDIKQTVLGVVEETLRLHGAVSESVVCEMVDGVSVKFGADCAVATSGIAGPGGATPDKPVGTVWVAVKIAGRIKTRLLRLQDKGRDKNIASAVYEALEFVKENLER